MISKAQKFRLGVFLITGMVLLLGSVILIAAPRLLEKRDIYTIRYVGVSVGGLEPGGSVKYQGIPVGRIEEVYVDPNNVSAIVVKISLRQGTPIKADTQAQVAMQGITGMRYIELIGGTESAETIPPGGEIPPGDSMIDLFVEQAQVISEKLQIMLDEMIVLINNVNGLMLDNRGQLNQVTANVELISENLISVSQRADSIMSNIETLTADPKLTESIDNIHAMTVALRQSFEEKNLPEIMTNLNQLITTIDQAMVHFDRTLVESRDDIIISFEDLRLSMENLREITEIVRDNPSVLIRGVGKEEISE